MGDTQVNECIVQRIPGIGVNGASKKYILKPTDRAMFAPTASAIMAYAIFLFDMTFDNGFGARLSLGVI